MAMMMVLSVGVRRKDVENKNFKLYVVNGMTRDHPFANTP
jgi:hypothetical protein